MRSPQQFALAVKQMADVVNVVFMGENAGLKAHPLLVWPEMAEPHWREAAMNEVNALGTVSDAQFCEPNEVNNWTFKARRRIVA